MVIIGLFIGGMVPYLFAAMGMEAVGRAAGSVVVEVRRQFKEIPGIMEGHRQAGIRHLRRHADQGRDQGNDCSFSAACRSSGDRRPDPRRASTGRRAGWHHRHRHLRRDLHDHRGGAWDNAKKYIEEGNFGGKGSEAHKAAVTGDTVGDPYKTPPALPSTR